MGLFSGILKVAAPIAGALTGKSWIGSALSAAGGFLGQRDTNAQNRQMELDQMRFQQDMSGTAHQREVKDLVAAGLNPMLSSRYGGASTPAGASAVVGNSAAAADEAATSADNRRLIDAQIKSAESQAALNSANAAKAVVEAREVASRADTSEFNLERERYLKDWFKSWDLAGSMLDLNHTVRYGDAALSREQIDVLNELKRMAKREGFNTWDAAIANQEFSHSAIRLLLDRNMMPKSEAEAAFYRSDFGKEIAPYISSAQGLTNVAAGAAGIGRKFGVGLRRK